VVAERIRDPSLAQPVILVFDRRDLNRAGENSLRGDGIGV
jgi:hypothetical protein